MIYIRIFAVLMMTCFSHHLAAEVIYNDIHQRNLDFTYISIPDLMTGSCSKSVKCKYLLALHEARIVYTKEKSVRTLESLAASDVLDAKHSLYEISRWVGVDNLTPEKALNYLKESAEEGYAPSQMELAKAYIKGAFGEKDPTKSHFWLLKASEQGYVDAMPYVANNYYSGRGVPRDDVKGFEWLIKALNASGRDFIRWNMLGEAYEEGAGTPIDLVKAYMCYDLEGTAGIEDKTRIASRMTAAQREEGLRLSQEWQQKNHVYTMQSLGLKRQKDGSYQ